jgi:hypothetical protein
MKLSRAKRLVEQGKAKWRWDNKIHIRYLKLLYKPSGEVLEDLYLGFDPGSCFDGISITSKRCHHLNIEIIHYKGKYNSKTEKVENLISKALKKKSGYRRNRRNRKRHRKIRFSNRIRKNTICPTIRNVLDRREWMIEKILKLFRINTYIYEMVLYRNKVQKESFTQVHQSQRIFIEFLKSKGKVKLSRGWDTKRRRVDFFGKDLKSNNKADRTFYAHCLDSFILSLKDRKFRSGNVNYFCRYIESIKRNLRELTKFKAKEDRKARGNIPEKIQSKYYRYSKGKKIVYVTKYSKFKKIRVKPSGENSNHPKRWEYRYTEEIPCVKSCISSYGGTKAFGISKFMVLINNSTGKLIDNSSRKGNRFKKIRDMNYRILYFKRQNVEVSNL